MTSVVADTHTLIWYVFDLQRLSSAALTALEKAVNTGNPIYVSAITIIEIAYLVEKGRFSEEVLTRILWVGKFIARIRQKAEGRRQKGRGF
ncbi:MAG: hypothetical protein KME59_10425 [Trichormus sp. ATA11-4-KO1]|jgi:PIN domain nuclease of toxin-antitoxin system|nr:hypothetical protein [Trichormus sp. ATA11-4-KO1]